MAIRQGENSESMESTAPATGVKGGGSEAVNVEDNNKEEEENKEEDGRAPQRHRSKPAPQTAQYLRCQHQRRLASLAGGARRAVG